MVWCSELRRLKSGGSVNDSWSPENPKQWRYPLNSHSCYCSCLLVIFSRECKTCISSDFFVSATWSPTTAQALLSPLPHPPTSPFLSSFPYPHSLDSALQTTLLSVYPKLFFPLIPRYQPGETPNPRLTNSPPSLYLLDRLLTTTVENPQPGQAHVPTACPPGDHKPHEGRDLAYHVLCAILSNPYCPAKEATQTFVEIPTEWRLQCCLEICISQDELGYAMVTNSPQISVVSNDRGLFPTHTVSVEGQL